MAPQKNVVICTRLRGSWRFTFGGLVGQTFRAMLRRAELNCRWCHSSLMLDVGCVRLTRDGGGSVSESQQRRLRFVWVFHRHVRQQHGPRSRGDGEATQDGVQIRWPLKQLHPVVRRRDRLLGAASVRSTRSQHPTVPLKRLRSRSLRRIGAYVGRRKSSGPGYENDAM